MTLKRLVLAVTSATLLVGGCAHGPRIATIGQQVNSTVHDAYLRTVSVGTVESSIQIFIQAGPDTLTGVKGNAALNFRDGTAEATLTLEPGGPMTVVSTSEQMFEGHPATAPAAGMAWNTIDLQRNAQKDPSQLPQIQAPGLDPFQLPTLLEAVRWPTAIAGERPVFMTSAHGTVTNFEILVDTAKLSALLHKADRAWLAEMSRETGGKTISLSVAVEQGRIKSITADLPVPAPAMPKTSKKPKVTVTAPSFTPPPLHAVIELQFDYRAPAISISVPNS